MSTFIDGEIQWTPKAEEAEATLSLTWSSELMQSHATGRVIDGSGNASVVAIRDANGDPIVFSIGTDGHLYVIVRQRGHATGWGQFDLTGALDGGLQVASVAVGQESNGAFTVVIVSRGEHRVFATRALANDTAMDWENFHTLWSRRAAKQVDAVTSLQVGASQLRDAGGRAIGPLVLLAAREGGDEHYYHVDVDVERAGEPEPWKRLQLPVQANRILGVQVGKGKSGRTSAGDGVYIFSELQNVRHLHFVTLPDSAGRVRRVALPVAPGMTSFAVLPEGRSGATGLYYAGDGLHYLPPLLQESDNTDPGTLTRIAAPAEVSGLRGLIARDDEHSVALWAVDAEKRLRYVIGRKATAEAGAVWEPPIVLCRDVAQLAPIRNQVRTTNDMIVIQGGGRLRHLAQDPTTTVWHDQDIPLQDVGKLQTFDSYTTQITVSLPDGPAANRRFDLTASEWCEVVIDGVAHQLHTGLPHPVTTDLDGRITIIRRAEGIAPPIYRLGGGGLPERVVIHPAQKIADGLKRLESAEGIRDEKRQDGKPLVTRTLTPEQREDAAKGITQLNGLAGTLPRDGGVSTDYLRGVDLAAQGQLTCWGMSLDGGAVAFFEEDDAVAMMRDALSTTLFFDERDDHWGVLRKIAGDVLAWIRNAAEEGFRFLVRRIDDAWQFVVQIGKEAFRFVVSCLGHVYNAVNSVLQKAFGLNLNDLVDWLGFLFAWDDILKTQAVIANVSRQSMKYADSQIETMKREVDRAFDQFLKMAESIKPIGGERGNFNVRSENGDSVSGRLPESGKKALAFLTKSPAGGFAGYQMMHGGVRQGGPGADEAFQADDAVTNFFDRTLRPFLRTVEESIRAVGEDFRKIFSSGQMSPDQIIRTLSSTVILGVLKSVRDLVKGILEAFREIMAQLAKLIDDEREIPFLSALFRHVTKGRKPSILEAFSLIVAIPATLAFKLVTGKAPFADGTGGLDTDGHVELFRKFRQPALVADGEAANALWTYSIIGGGISVGGAMISGSLDAAMVALGSKRPGWMGLIFDLVAFGASVPVGNWNLGRLGGWCVRAFGLVRGLYDFFAPAELIFSGIFQIVQAIVKGVFDVAKLIAEIGGRWETAVWAACEDVLALCAACLTGSGKITVNPEWKPILAGFAATATLARGVVGGGRVLYLARIGPRTLAEA